MPMTPDELTIATGRSKDLMSFCSTNALRPALLHPWNYGEHTYAADGVVIVRVPRRAEWDSFPGVHAKSATRLFDGFPDPGVVFFRKLATLPDAPLRVECPHCKESGDGEDCEGCDGDKLVPNPLPVDVGSRQLPIHQLLKIAVLPGLLVAQDHGKGSDPLAFLFDGGAGLLMPNHRRKPSTSQAP